MKTREDDPIRLQPEYLNYLVKKIAAAGGQKVVGDAIGVDQATVSRNLRKPTSTTIRKITDYLKAPPAIVSPVDEEHARWCLIGEILRESYPTVFAKELGRLVKVARDQGIDPGSWDPDSSESSASDDALRNAIGRPGLGGKRKRDRGG